MHYGICTNRTLTDSHSNEILYLSVHKCQQLNQLDSTYLNSTLSFLKNLHDYYSPYNKYSTFKKTQLIKITNITKLFSFTYYIKSFISTSTNKIRRKKFSRSSATWYVQGISREVKSLSEKYHRTFLTFW